MSRHGLIQGKYRHEDGLWDDIRVPANVVVNVPGPLEPVWLPFIDDGGGSEGTYALWYDIDLSLIHISEPTNRTRSRMPSSA